MIHTNEITIPESESLRKKAEALLSQGESQEAVKILLALQTSYPTHSGIMNDLGVIFSQSGMVELGKGYFERALYLNPSDEDAKENLRSIEKIISQNQTSIEIKKPTMNAPRILFVAENLHPPYGGAENSAIAIMKMLLDEGYEVNGICKGDYDKEYVEEGINYRHITDIAKLAEVVEFAQQDLILTQLNWAPEAVELAKKCGKPAFVFIRSYEHFCSSPLGLALCAFQCNFCPEFARYQVRLNKHRWMFQQVDRIFSNSQFINHFQERFTARFSEVIYPVIEFDKVVSPLHDPAFIALARPTQEKGLPLFNDIAKLMPNEQMLLFGRNGVTLKKLLNKNIFFWGHGDPRIPYSKAKLLLLPSLWLEPFGRVVLEAMANGIPVIASRIGGLPEAGGEAALYIDNFTDPYEWKKIIEKVLKDEEFYHSLQEMGFQQVKWFQKREDLDRFKIIVRETIQQNKKPISVSELTKQIPLLSFPQNGKGRSLQVKTPFYLPLSETFIYNYFRNLKLYPPLVLTHEIKNLKVFPLAHPIITYNYAPYGDANLRSLLEDLVRQNHIRLIHAHFGHVGAEFIDWAKFLNLPLITSFYGKDASTYLKDPNWKIRFQKLFDDSAGITVLSQEMKQRLITAGCPQEKLHIIHLGIDVNEYQFRMRKLSPGETVKFLCVGRLVEKKGFDDAIRAFAQIRNNKKYQLRIIGEGPLEEELRPIARQLGVEKEVFFLGGQTVQYVREEMAVNHILLAPSKTASDGDQEGTPTVLMEAQACGMPVISTVHTGIPEVVEDGITGFLVKEGDWNNLSRKMLAMVELSEKWPEMGLAGQKKVQQEFNILTETAKLENLYAKVVNLIPSEETIMVNPLKEELAISPTRVQSKRIHIAVDASSLEDRGSKVRGIGRYMYNHFKELIKLRKDWHFTICGLTEKPFLPEVEELASQINSDFIPWKKFSALNPDILYLPNPTGPITLDIIQLGAMSEIPMICTFHDLIPLIFPDLYLDLNENFKKLYLQQINLLLRNCRLFLCNSHCTANDLHHYLHIPQERLRVIHAGITDNFNHIPSIGDIEMTLRKFRLPAQRFLLFIGVPDNRKNAFGMFKALDYARKTLNEDLKLAIVGDIPDFLLKILRNLVIKCGLDQGAVIYTGFVSEEELNSLYHSALALLFPSLYEGFGFPIVEANSAGLPVIAGNNSAQVETAGEAALLVDALNTEEIAKAIIKLYQDPILRQDLREKGLVNCQRFSWRKVAEKSAEYIEEFVGSKIPVV